MTKRAVFLAALLTVAVAIAAIWIISLEKTKEPSYSNQLVLASAYNNRESYDGIFSGLKESAVKPKARAGIISHHFLAAQLIADFYNTIGDKDVSTVFLISPDHYYNFFPSGTVAYTSNLDWQTPFGGLAADKTAIDSLLKGGKVKTSDFLFGLEHGIYVEIPFIRFFYPQATIVPLVVNMGIGYDNFVSLGKEIGDLSSRSSILIVSSDFSHGVSTSETEAQDEKSIEILKNLQASNLGAVNSDCRQCLAVLSGFLSNGHRYDFNLISNKNSSDFSDSNGNSVTSYISGYYTEKSTGKKFDK